MWYITKYRPVSLVTLKVATATSTGGKSLLVPTPFAVKMALLDRAIWDVGIEQVESIWPGIRAAAVALRGPEQIAVTNTFTKILKPNRNAGIDPDTGLMSAMIRSIGFREYVQWQGDVEIALYSPQPVEQWPRWLTEINYLGKRGGFIQALDEPSQTEALPDSFSLLTEAGSEGFVMGGTLQILDDCGPELSFDQVNIYSSKGMRVGKDRILRPVVLPYRQTRASRGYTLYERMG